MYVLRDRIEKTTRIRHIFCLCLRQKMRTERSCKVFLGMMTEHAQLPHYLYARFLFLDFLIGTLRHYLPATAALD